MPFAVTDDKTTKTPGTSLPAAGTTSRFANDFRLFWISVILLFLELLIIRWLSAELRIFAYFHNLVLIICFLGIGLGCARSQRTASFIPPLAILAALVFLIYCPVKLGIFSIKNITAYLSTLKDFVIWHGVETVGIRAIWAILLGTAMLGLLTVGIVYLFVPFGQLLGQLLAENKRPLRAYTINILGSLFGILLFTLLSFVSSPPIVWFALLFTFIIVLFLTENAAKLIVPSLPLMAATIALLLWRGDLRMERGREIWSPYQKLEIRPMDAREGSKTVRIGYLIEVNNSPYQSAVNLSYEFINAHPQIYGFCKPDMVKFDHYNLPYLFGNKLDDVLIVGAGAGNDVAGALRKNAVHVDAVEIDPVILKTGEELHPEQPYASERVTKIVDDARSFFHRTKKKYDLVVFGLLDSHTLSSNLSNVRLDNFVYTLQGIEEARGLLKPRGVLVLIFQVQDEFIGESLYKIVSRAFNAPPLCFKVQGTRGGGGSVFVAGDQTTIWNTMTKHPFLHVLIDRSFENSESPTHILTDDWPYLYLSSARIPSLYYIIFGFLMIISTVMVRRNFSGIKGIDWHFFFLGAGFLLIEVQNVSRLALLFGSTWVVNSIIISAILIMILLANYYVSAVNIKSHAPYYAGLAGSLLLIYFVPLQRLASFSIAPKAAISGAVLSLPIFFAGIIFAQSFRKSKELHRVFASNLIGAMLGGMLECASFMVGIKALLFLALALYLLSFATLSKLQPE